MLKTFIVSTQIIGLTEEKAHDLKEKVKEFRIETKKLVGPTIIRRLAGYQAITKRWMKDLLGAGGSRRLCPAHGQTPTPASSVPWEIPTFDEFESEYIHNIPAETISSNDSEEIEKYPAGSSENNDYLKNNNSNIQKGSSYTNSEIPNDKFHYQQFLPYNLSTEHTELTSNLNNNNNNLFSLSSVTAAGDTPRGVGGSIRRAVPLTLRPVTRVAVGGLDSGPPAASLFKVLEDKEVIRAIRTGRKIGCGDKYKGGILDLRGLDPAFHKTEDLRLAVNRVLKLGKRGRRVQVLIHPREEWTAMDSILGNPGDTQYRRVASINHEEGLMLTLQTRQKYLAGEAKPTAPDGAEVVVEGARMTSQPGMIWNVDVRVDGELKVCKVKVTTMNRLIAYIEALAGAAEIYSDRTIALRTNNILREYLCSSGSSRHVGLGASIDTLKRNHAWGETDGWLVGQPKTNGDFSMEKEMKKVFIEPADEGEPLPENPLEKLLHEDVTGGERSKIKWKRIGGIKTAEPFSNLYPINPAVLAAVMAHMEEHGYDASQPVTVWKEEGIVVDGHTRLEAARQLGLDEIPVVEISFRNEDEALKYAIHNQRDRRNLSQAQLLKLVELVDQRRKKGGDRKSKSYKDGQKSMGRSRPIDSRSAADTARIVGMGQTMVKQIRVVLKDDEEAKAAVQSGSKTITQAYEEIQAKKRLEEARVGSGSVLARLGDDEAEIARWRWNIVTGCSSNCTDCPVRDIVKRDYGTFSSRFHDNLLDAPANTKVPDNPNAADRNVMVAPLGDLFSNYMQSAWRDRILQVVEDNPQWNFIFMTKFPKNLVGIKFPANAWVGSIVDNGVRVRSTFEAFKEMRKSGTRPSVLFIACDPMKTTVEIDEKDLKLADWVIIGGGAKTPILPDGQPRWAWVESLLKQARAAKCKVFFKRNLTVRPMEMPEASTKPKDGDKVSVSEDDQGQDDRATGNLALNDYYKEAGECTACRTKNLIHRNPDDKRWAFPLFHKDPNSRAEILFIGEAPNKSATYDEHKGFLAIGDYGDPAGEFMNKLLSSVGLRYEDVIFSNTVLCLPSEVDGNHSPSVAQAKLCSPWLHRLIDIINPSVVVTFGMVALQGLKRIEKHSYVLQQDVGHLRPWAGRLLLPLYHPSQLGRIHRSEADQMRDISVLKDRPWRSDSSTESAGVTDDRGEKHE